MFEEWRDVVGFEGHYKVSSFGNVYSVPRKGADGRALSGKMLSGRLGGKRQYANVQLKQNGMTFYRYVHRLVAEAFHENANGYPEVNHKDRNRRNNCCTNLEWITPQRNTEHSISKSYKLNMPEGVLEVFNLRRFCRENNYDRNRIKKLIIV